MDLAGLQIMRNKPVPIIGLSIAILISSGCFPRPDFIEPGFVLDSAFAEGIVVGGVALVEDPAAELKYAQFLERSLREQEQYKVAGVALVKKSLGTKQYGKLLRRYRNNRSISAESLQALAHLLDGYRYIVFVHFEKSNLRSDEDSEIIYNDKGKEESRKVTKTVTRTAKVRLAVYDLSTGIPVIKDRKDVHVSNSKEYEESYEKDFVLSLLGEILFPRDETDPAPPSHDEVVESGLTRVYRILAVDERCFLPGC
jgi:hypothetical protein